MKKSYQKYIPFEGVKLNNRTWPDKKIERAPIWCSVDLRDGNQALVNPMNLEQKLRFFKMICDVGIKEIEVGFPSASETEYEILRTLIDDNLIPDDVTIQVLVQAREHLIRKTFDAIKGAKNVIVHFYNSTSTLQRKVVFETDMLGVIGIAVDGAKLIKSLADEMIASTGMNIRYEYSPESFSGTETDNAVWICNEVMKALGANEDEKVIINLPNTVEMSTPNTYADQIEYFCRRLENKKAAIISVHPHNDRGTATAATELAIMAGAQRVEGTIFGNGERTGNTDIMNVAMNMFSQGVDPLLDFSDINAIRDVYEECTNMRIHERHPYVGELVFTAFSGSHQDAINKGTAFMQKTNGDFWEIPYLPIDPADVGREYEPTIRINSQSGKGGAAYVMQQHGFSLPKQMHAEFGSLVKEACDKLGREISPEEVLALFKHEYIELSEATHEVPEPCKLGKYRMHEERHNGDDVTVEFDGTLIYQGKATEISGSGNGPIDAFFNALHKVGFENYDFISYSEHAIAAGSDSKAVSYIRLKHNDKEIFGVGIDNNISVASIKGILSAINRQKMKGIRKQNGAKS